MQNFCRINLFAFILFIISSFASQSFGQTDVAIGTGTTSNSDWDYPCPLPDSYGSMRMQFLYLASEMTAAGMTPGSINAIRFDVSNLGNYFDPATSHVDKLIIKIGSTSSGTLNQTTWEPGTAVVYGPVDYLPVQGQNTFTLSTPFFWNGTDNIVIEMCTDGTISGTRTANPHVTWTTGLAFNGSHSMGELFTGGMCDATGYSNMGTATSRPNIIFNYSAAPPCSNATLTAGTAASKVASVCIDEPFGLGLNGATVATGLTYQWQSSTDHVNWTDINKATEAALTTKQHVTTWYRAIVTCASGGTATSADVQVITPLPLSGTFTIDKTLPAGSGNFTSFNDAYNYIKCGINGPVVFNVAQNSGVYAEQLILQKVPGASATNTITFNGATGASVEYAAFNTNERAVIKLNGADYFVFNDLAVNAIGSQYGYGFQLLNDADTNVINGCSITTDAINATVNYAGIVVSGWPNSATQQVPAYCDGNTFSGNTITGGYFGITLVGSSSAANANNKIINNHFEDFGAYAVYVACSFNTLIDNNHLSRPVRSDDYSTVYGIYATNINTRMTVSKNTITHIFNGGAENASFYGIYFSAAAALGGLENTISNNLIYNINGGGTLYGIYNNVSHNALYYHNTISLDGDGSSVAADKAVIGFYQNDATGVQFYNNNIVITRSGLAAHTAMYFNTPGTDLQSDRNNLYVTAGAGVRQTGYINGAGRILLSDWVTASGRDNNSINADPLFTDLAAGNLTPANPALDNAGVNVGITVDITGATRNNPPDIGAFEFSPPPCPTPPTPGTVVLSVSAICVGESLTISLTGNSIGAGQTYQLESASNAGGPFTTLGNSSANPVFSFTASVTMYYRIAITCSGNTVYTPVVQLIVFQAFPSGTYTINKNAAPSLTNFTSFAAAKDALACGIAGPVVFNVEPNSGPYNEQLILTPVKGASVINTITFNGNGNTIQFSSDDYNEKAVIKLRGADHFIFDSLVIDATGTGSYGYGVQLLNNADSNIVRKCTINAGTTSSSDGFAGIVISALDGEMYATGDTWCDNNLFEGNTINGGYWGVSIAGDPVYFSWQSNFIYDNKLINNTIRDFYERGIYLIGAERTVIENNIIARPTRTDVSSFYGIYVESTSGDLAIRRNRITNPFGGNTGSSQTFFGMYFDFAGHELKGNVTNNLIYNINGNGTEYGIYLNTTREFNFYHNTISLDNQSVAGANTSGAYGVYTSNSAGNIEFRNNIVTITRSGSGLKYGFNVASGDVIGFALDKNDYYINGAGGNNHIGYRNSNRTTLADWQSATHRDANAYSIDPVYANPATGNFVPTIAPLNDNGDPLGVLKDILNQDRSTSTPDIGAYEFTPAPCLSGVLAGSAVATPNSGFCMGTTITLSLSGNTTSGYQTYRWEKSTTGTGNWQRISDTLYVSTFKTEATGSDYYRCIVSCTGLNDTSTMAQIQLNAPLPGGIYTINNDGTGNYASFTAAVAAMQCGIGGAVTFDVAPGTYNEQVYIRRIPGASDTSRVTFRAANGNASSVILTAAGTSTANYVLKLDSAHYITFTKLSITATSGTNARVVELAGNSSYDSLLNNIITTVTTTNTATSRAAIFASPIKGDGIVIRGNSINNGSSGIYIAGTFINRNRNLVIEGNTVKGFYQYGIYTVYNNRSRIANNSVTVAAPTSNTTYGIYTADADSSFTVTGNNVQINNTTTTVHAIYCLRPAGRLANPGIIEANKVTAVTGNTGMLYGINVNSASYSRIVNNVVSIKTSGVNSYGLYSSNNTGTKVYNNTILSAATSTNINAVAWFGDGGSDLHYADIRNNIFSHEGNGVALFISDNSWNVLQRLYSDYNLLYTTGVTLVQHGSTASYATLADWQQGGDLDLNSIVFKPALVSAANPEPDVNAPEVWAIHGRGVQINDNDHDINNQSRPVSLKAGVPDLGAYEFVPASVPVATVANPAAPAPNTQQVFMLGTDTVAFVNWSASVPTNITVRRYSGVKPNGLAAGMDYMYFYTDVEASGGGAYTYSIDQRYLDPWRGFIDNESRIRLGKTDNAGAWSIDAASTVNTLVNSITQSGLDFMDQFTGLTDPTIAYPPSDSSRTDTLNLGLRFWVGYGHNEYIDNFTIRMGGGDKDANVTVKVHGTNWVRNYHIPAHTFIISEPIPRNGASGAFLATEGLSDRGISIESDEPIAVFSYCEGGLSATGSTMLLPVGAYGYEYYALTYAQYNIEISSTFNVHSWFYVIADHDSTLVEITPSNPTLGGRTQGVPFTVTLNKGEVYQVLGAIKTQNECYDMSGSKVRSISNASGNCYPVAVFSGNTDAYIDCAESFVPFGSFLIQQNYPVQSWGRKYLTAPTSKSGDPGAPQTNFYRVLVKDPATVVKVNGATLTGLVNNSFYEYQSNHADYIEADMPVMVAQFIPGTSNVCDFGFNTDPEMFYLPPMGEGIKKADLYRTDLRIDDDNFLTVIIPTNGLTSLLIDGSNQFDSTYTHPNMAGYSVVVKRWEPAETTSTIQSDSMFTALGYGFGSNTYGYVVGKTIVTWPAKPGITNIYDSSGNYSAYTCVGTPFKYSVLLPVMPTRLTWQFSKAANMVPDTDSVQLNPVAVGTEVINGRSYYRFALQKEYAFPTVGDYTVPLEYVHPVIENCSNSVVSNLTVHVVGAPVVDINAVTTGCIGDSVQFAATVTAQNNDVVHTLHWNFGDNTTSDVPMPLKLYQAAGTYNVKVDVVTQIGCIASVTEPLVLKGPAAFDFVSDTVNGCPNAAVTLAIKDPETGVVYNWYDNETGGAVVHTGANLTINPFTATKKYYVAATKDGCTTKPRQVVTAWLLPSITTPIVRVDSTGTNQVRFAWTAVPGAAGYQVSTDGGTTWSTPSSGANGLTHTVTGLNGGQQVTLLVKALDPNHCQDRISAPATTNTLPDQIFIPNAFSPNNDGLNDEFKVEGFIIRSMQLRVFNQWGEIVFETTDQNRGWDGKHKGKLQPSGVYMYVCSMVLQDGSKVVRKGAVNLVR